MQKPHSQKKTKKLSNPPSFNSCPTVNKHRLYTESHGESSYHSTKTVNQLFKQKPYSKRFENKNKIRRNEDQ